MRHHFCLPSDSERGVFLTPLPKKEQPLNTPCPLILVFLVFFTSSFCKRREKGSHGLGTEGRVKPLFLHFILYPSFPLLLSLIFYARTKTEAKKRKQTNKLTNKIFFPMSQLTYPHAIWFRASRGFSPLPRKMVSTYILHQFFLRSFRLIALTVLVDLPLASCFLFNNL